MIDTAYTHIQIVDKIKDVESSSYATSQMQVSAVMCNFINGLSHETSIESATTRTDFYQGVLEFEASVLTAGAISDRLIVAEFAKAATIGDIQQLNFQPVIYISYKSLPISI